MLIGILVGLNSELNLITCFDRGSAGAWLHVGGCEMIGWSDGTGASGSTVHSISTTVGLIEGFSPASGTTNRPTGAGSPSAASGLEFTAIHVDRRR
jgi:hypothetical protein